ncbi:MAG: DUF5107 domain-containing protein [Oscillospiraceae bacterium]|nr:DUF5107 domain-containing protein [Oscillospiraceae bacterium]
MTELRVEKFKIPSVEFNGVSTLPSISENLRLTFMQDEFELSEDDELFVNYGMVEYGFPYKAQDNYTRKLQEKEQTCVVLENDYLKATFLPQFGGKLHSLFDKSEGKELLFVNSVVRPCHLGVRNAWMSGGVEWNCGYVGHNAFTCDWMHTARTQLDDGTPVLRFYQYERIRGIVYQMDFFLPEGSRLLFVRTKIVNPQFQVVPMYWWSNIAAPDVPGNRVIVPVDNTFTARHSHPVKIAVPEYNGTDITYPLNNVISIDYFWNIPAQERKFICQVDKEGYGLVQTSTKRLKGRKLFVWGNSEGGDRWKNFLTADNESGSYNEIQAGVAKTQYECLPMPPKTVWEWVEAHGAIRMDPQKAHGGWEEAKQEAASCLDCLVLEEELERLLQSTKAMAKSPALETLFHADGWGALEQERRKICGEDPMCGYLDFGSITQEQMPWLSLLQKGTIGGHNPTDPPVSYMCQQEWTEMLKCAVHADDADNWFAWMQLGLNTFIQKDYERAEQMLLRSVEKQVSPWALYALAILNRDAGNHEKEVSYMLKAWRMRPDDISLAKEVLRSLYQNRCFKDLKEVYEKLPEMLRQEPRCMVYYAFALLDEGNVAGAEAILYKDGGILIPDLRECETITLDLWVAVQKKRAELFGEAFDESTMEPPRFADFRMFANLEWLNGGEVIHE